MGAASRERPDATSPRTATTLSREISLRTMVADSPALVWLSSVISSTFFPSTPPDALISSIASAVPLCEDCPKAASLPVSEANSPTLIVSDEAPPPLESLLQPHKVSAAVRAGHAKDRISLCHFFISVSVDRPPHLCHLPPSGSSRTAEARKIRGAFQSSSAVEIR